MDSEEERSLRAGGKQRPSWGGGLGRSLAGDLKDQSEVVLKLGKR